MIIYTAGTRIKIGLLFFALTLVTATIFYSNSIVGELRNDNRQIVTVYSRIIAKTINEETDANLGFVFDEIIKKVQFPIIYTDASNNPLYYRNLNQGLDKQALLELVKSMDKDNDAISIKYNDPQSSQSTILGYLHYGDSFLIQQLQWLPYLEIVMVSIFILIGFIGFNSIRENEKRQIWVGMARETAHQLSTPISALIGWIERIESHPGETLKTAEEMKSDMVRLEQIAERFSQMGTESPLKKISMTDLIDYQTQYLRKRIPSLGKDTELNVSIDDEIFIMGNEVLLGWAIENLIRNGIDSIKSSKGKVAITVKKEGNYACIDIADNGAGISKKDWNNIFSPGYSSKKRGWGLGLSLVKRIINEIHRGKIMVISSTIGEGTTFQIKLEYQR
ncbi:MAG: HAMP domain-containing sensor histidine kinase [Candidatus Neomarinimicrobiota bacterium]|nr:HAMP domain-containing sensor histidine kinase [Candidatus Neomarinimicrobiota bacterium]